MVSRFVVAVLPDIYFFNLFLKNDDKDPKIGIPPYFLVRNQLVTFSKPNGQQGCQICRCSVARFGIAVLPDTYFFSFYCFKNDDKDSKIEIPPYFRTKNCMVKFSKPYGQQDCQICHCSVARYILLQFIS